MLDPVDGERANVIVQALVTVDIGSPEARVIELKAISRPSN